MIAAYLLAKKPKDIKGVILSAPLLSSTRWERDQRENINLLPDEAAVKTCKDFQMSFPNAALAVIPNAAHLHQIEQPEIYLAVVKAFLQSIAQ